MFILLSESYDGGGAERVLAVLANSWENSDGPLRVVSLSHKNGYLAGHIAPEIFCVNRFRSRRLTRLYNIVKVALSINNGSTVMLCSYLLMLVIAPIARVKGFNIVFRPSIDYYYIRREVHTRFGRLLGAILLLLLEHAIRSTKLIYQSSGIERSFLRVDRGRRLGRIIPNPVSVDFRSFPGYAKPILASPLEVLLVGRLVPEKGFDRFLTQVVAPPGALRVHLCGEGPEYPILAQIAASKGIDLCRHGFVNLRNSKVSAALLVVPSRIEGFPNVVLEAALAGWPIVISKEVEECISGSPVASACEVLDFERLVGIESLVRVVSHHSIEDMFQLIMSVRKDHSVQSFKHSVLEMVV